MAKTTNAASLVAQYEQELASRIERWDYIKKHGSGDPMWPDGINLNLVRNHIIYYLTEIAKLRAQPLQLSMFDSYPGTPSQEILKDKRIPPQVPNNFMATNRKPRITYTVAE